MNLSDRLNVWSFRLGQAIDKSPLLYYFCFAVLVVVMAVSAHRVAGWIFPESNARLAQANKVVASIHYIQDPRTGLCFAYLPSNSALSSPTLAVVSREAIPKDLLIVAEKP